MYSRSVVQPIVAQFVPEGCRSCLNQTPSDALRRRPASARRGRWLGSGGRFWKTGGAGQRAWRRSFGRSRSRRGLGIGISGLRLGGIVRCRVGGGTRRARPSDQNDEVERRVARQGEIGDG